MVEVACLSEAPVCGRAVTPKSLSISQKNSTCGLGDQLEYTTALQMEGRAWRIPGLIVKWN